MRFTRVPAPITGRIGLSNVTEGALVTANQADALATITRLDPVYVDIQQSAADLLKLRQALSQGGAVPTSAQVRLKLPDGSIYGFTGTVEFSQVIVDQSTGTVTIRARFPNPQSILLPGMYRHGGVRAGDPDGGDPGSAAGGHPRSAGQCDSVRGRPRQPGGPAHGPVPTGRSAPTGWSPVASRRAKR